MERIDELRNKLISAAKRKVQEKYGEKDVHIIKSVNLLGDLDSAANLLTEQLREWYSVHFPELNDIVPDHMAYLRLAHYIGARENFTEQKILEQIGGGDQEKNVTEGPGKEIAEKIVSAAKDSIGSGVGEADMDEMRSLALNCLNLLEEREAISKYIEQVMGKELPNFSAVAGATIGAKILAKIGSKQKLAFVPASTLQIVGAEKALFLHIKMGVKGPKYGYLYQHPLVKAASRENKGRMARTIAAKLSIAAKMDYFGSEGNADEMKKQLEERAKELSERKHKEKPHKAEEPARKEERPAQRREFSEGNRPQFRERKQFGAERRGNFRERGSKGFRNEQPRGFRRNERQDGFRPRGNRNEGIGAESNQRRPFGSSNGSGGARRRRPAWKGGSRTDRRPFGNEGSKDVRPNWRGGKQKRDYHSTERKAFGHGQGRAGEGNFGSERPSGGKPHARGKFHGVKFHAKGRNKGDPARKRF